MSEVNLIARLEELLRHCVTAGPKIPQNPLSAEDYRNAQACVEQYKIIQDVPRNSDVERQGEHMNLESLFKQTTEILKRIDRYMDDFRFSHAVGFAKYKAARRVFDYGGKKKDEAAPGAAGGTGQRGTQTRAIRPPATPQETGLPGQAAPRENLDTSSPIRQAGDAPSENPGNPADPGADGMVA